MRVEPRDAGSLRPRQCFVDQHRILNRCPLPAAPGSAPRRRRRRRGQGTGRTGRGRRARTRARTAWGGADGRGTKAVVDTPFGAGPLLGTFLCVAALRLSERGELELDAPLAKLLPALYPAHPEITLDRLLTHTSGIPFYGERLSTEHDLSRFPDETILAWLASAPLAATPGTCAAYSDTDDFLLGLALETASGKPVRELLQREVFEPAGMGDSGWVAERSELVESAHLDQEFAGGEQEADLEFRRAQQMVEGPACTVVRVQLAGRPQRDEIQPRTQVDRHQPAAPPAPLPAPLGTPPAPRGSSPCAPRTRGSRRAR